MGKFINLTNKQFGLWTVKYRSKNNVNGKTQWMCECDCGTMKEVTSNSLRTCNSTSCGCNHVADLSNKHCGDLVVLGADYTTGHRLWKCVCTCGSTVVTSAYNLRNSTVLCCDAEDCVNRIAARKALFQYLHQSLLFDDKQPSFHPDHKAL